MAALASVLKDPVVKWIVLLSGLNRCSNPEACCVCFLLHDQTVKLKQGVPIHSPPRRTERAEKRTTGVARRVARAKGTRRERRAYMVRKRYPDMNKGDGKS